MHHRPALLWRFSDSDAGYKTAYLLTYLSRCDCNSVAEFMHAGATVLLSYTVTQNWLDYRVQ